MVPSCLSPWGDLGQGNVGLVFEREIEKVVGSIAMGLGLVALHMHTWRQLVYHL